MEIEEARGVQRRKNPGESCAASYNFHLFIVVYGAECTIPKSPPKTIELRRYYPFTETSVVITLCTTRRPCTQRHVEEAKCHHNLFPYQCIDTNVPSDIAL
jgi:hypothetical protein